MPLTADEAFQRFTQERPRIQSALQATEAHLRNVTARRGVTCEVTSRVKEASSFKNKIYRKGYADPWEQISDKAGIRVIVPHRGLLDPALETIKESLNVVDVEDHREAPGDEDRLRYPRLHVQAAMVGGEQDSDGTPTSARSNYAPRPSTCGRACPTSSCTSPASPHPPMSAARCTV